MAPSSPARPSLPRQHSRVPGGFDTDDDLSPIKTEFDVDDADQAYPGELLDATNYTKRGETQGYGASEDGQSLVHGNDSLIDEKEMGRKLMDVESSFLPELSPIGPSAGLGSAEDSVAGISKDGPERSAQYGKTESPDTPEENYKTPAPGKYEDLPPSQSVRDSSPDHANTSSLETMSSSPTAAAAARTVSRAISMASIGGYETAKEDSMAQSITNDTDQLDSQDTTPKNNTTVSNTTSHPSSPTPTKARFVSADTEEASNGDVDEENATSLRNPRKRPKFLSSRQASQRSSYSSYTSTEGASDLTIGAEYALQTGGAMPNRGSSAARPQMDLSRSISLGSMASGVSTLSDGEDRLRSVSNGLDSLQSLPEEGDSSSALLSSRSEVPLTPTPAGRFLEHGADTVAAPYTRDTEIPGTVKGRQEGRNVSSPDRRAGLPTPATSRSKNLTLKEQSSTIDKLQKENWDLKLKIKFMGDLINQRSEEGVNAIMSENVNLRTDKVKARKEIREQKSMIRELEFRIKKMEEEKAARAREQTESSSPTRGSEFVQELETEVVYLRERVETSEVEIEKLRHEGVAKDIEKRRLGEIVKSMSERKAGSSDIGAREELVCSNSSPLGAHLLITMRRICGRIFLKLRRHVVNKPTKRIEPCEKNCGVGKLIRPPEYPSTTLA